MHQSRSREHNHVNGAMKFSLFLIVILHIYNFLQTNILCNLILFIQSIEFNKNLKKTKNNIILAI